MAAALAEEFPATLVLPNAMLAVGAKGEDAASNRLADGRPRNPRVRSSRPELGRDGQGQAGAYQAGRVVPRCNGCRDARDGDVDGGRLGRGRLRSGGLKDT